MNVLIGITQVIIGSLAPAGKPPPPGHVASSYSEPGHDMTVIASIEVGKFPFANIFIIFARALTHGSNIKIWAFKPLLCDIHTTNKYKSANQPNKLSKSINRLKSPAFGAIHPAISPQFN